MQRCPSMCQSAVCAQRPHTMAARRSCSVLHGGGAQASSTTAADLPGNKSWSQTGSTKGLVLPGQLGPRWLAGHHVMLCIDEPATSAFKRREMGWTRALLAAATFQGLSGRLIPEWATALHSHVSSGSGYAVVFTGSGAGGGGRGLALLVVINHMMSTFHSTAVPPTSGWA